MPGHVFVCSSVTGWHSCYHLHESARPLADSDLRMKSKYSLCPPSSPLLSSPLLSYLSLRARLYAGFPFPPHSLFNLPIFYSLSTSVHFTRAETELGWYRSFGMDPNDSTYMVHLVAQAQAHPAG